MPKSPVALYSGIIGAPSIGFLEAKDTTARVVTGTVVQGVDPYWGPFTAMYAKANGIYKVGHVVYFAIVSDVVVATRLPTTANKAYSIGFCVAPMAASNYGWFKLAGRVPALSNDIVAVGAAIGFESVGRLNGAQNGKQLLNCRVERAADTTVVKTAYVTSGSTKLRVGSVDGWFVGIGLSGTGIPAGATIADIDYLGSEVTMSAAATASGIISCTGTYNDGAYFWNVLYVEHAVTQGQIT